MKNRKWISLLLAVVMIFSMAEGAIASEAGEPQTMPITVSKLESVGGIGENLVVVGSDGKQYEEVEYLTASAVNQFSEEQKENYEWLCDRAADLTKNETDYSSIEVVVNEKEIPELRYSLPMKKMLSMAGNHLTLPSMRTADSEGVQEFNESFDRAAYFRDQLSDTAQVFFDAAAEAAEKGKTKFSVKQSTTDENDLFLAVSTAYNAYPELFEWRDPASDAYTTISREEENEYCGFKSPKSKYYKKSLETKAKKKIRSLVKKAKSYAKKNYPDDMDFGMVYYFDSWLCKNNYYNNKGASDKKKDMKSAAFYYCHSSYGCLLKKYGVCESYARAMSRLLDAAGITNLFVVGDVTDEGGTGGHAWNYVRMGENWYLEDATWNDPAGKKKKDSNREYFLIGSSDENRMGSSHDANGQNFNNIQKLTYPALSSTGYVEYEEEEDDWDDDDWDGYFASAA